MKHLIIALMTLTALLGLSVATYNTQPAPVMPGYAVVNRSSFIS